MTIDEVEQQFESWRKHRCHPNDRIPAELLQKALGLVGDISYLKFVGYYALITDC